MAGTYYSNIKRLGAGAFGEVWLMKAPDGKEVAVKKIKNPDASAWNEVHMLRQLNHEDIVQYIDAFKCTRSGDLCIVMEYCDDGTMATKFGNREVKCFPIT